MTHRPHPPRKPAGRRPSRRTVAGAAAGGLAIAALLFLLRPPREGAPTRAEHAYKAFDARLQSMKSCARDADCERVRESCACTAVARRALADFKEEEARFRAAAGEPACPDWVEPSCDPARSQPVCVAGACRVHVTLEDASWDQ